MDLSLILFDDQRREKLLPFTFLRPVADIRIGILTIREKWEQHFKIASDTLTVDELQDKFPFNREKKEFLYVNGGILPDPKLIETVQNMPAESGLSFKETVIAVRTHKFIGSFNEFKQLSNFSEYGHQVLQVERPWDIFIKNGEALELDYQLLTKGRKSVPLSKTNTLLGDRIFIEEGAKVECAIINTTTGPVYIGKDAEIMEGSVIRGPFALCEGATTKLGCKVYGPTTIGPYSKIGGEVSNSVIFGYSNKAHDGFLGNSVIAEWCNLGADTNNSNLKNNYSPVKVWSYFENDYIDTGLLFCGLLMGDHSKTGINTMFNTGTVVGIFANIVGAGFPDKHIRSFSWGGAEGFESYHPEKAIEAATRMYGRRNLLLEEMDKRIIRKLSRELAVN